MIELFLFNFLEFLRFLGEEGIFICCFIALFVPFVVCLFVSIFKSNYSIKKRLWLIVLNCGVLSLEAWAEKTISAHYTYLLFNAGVSMLLFSIVLSIRERLKKPTKKQKDFVKYLDNCIKNQPNEYAFNQNSNYVNFAKSNINEYTPLRVQAEPTQVERRGEELDFSHVKAILNKLEYYSISSVDKRQANDLENLILTAETNGLNQELKEKINDGLGALLKIMAKYAI